MINNTSTSTDKDVNASPELIGLLINVTTTINSQHIILAVMVLQSLQFLSYLKSELSGGGQNHSLRLACPKEALRT